MEEIYRTVAGTATARIEEKKSEFIADVSFADSEAAALAFLESVRAAHRTARHHVYAYVLRDGARQRYSDDGEPAKTAGVPTLEAIQHAQLTNCIVVTTRYFGGVLLGTGGLVRAYTQAASLALAAARQVTMCRCVQGTWQVPYALYEQAARLLREAGARAGAPVFANDVRIPFTVLESGREQVEKSARELCRGAEQLAFSSPEYAAF